ncbi:hypothetical protein Y032_0061g3291 [Ancylostoma ceylanicum]|uniref:DUF7869 domain-containing protein n=1 Tax=Ancylostoma ceylanicum TaxID=53326 RepID=A0A016U3Y9_9BILA|nr:hypothetical protein Y032_0061g3291 [Ancylostoma ceylanicum]
MSNRSWPEEDRTTAGRMRDKHYEEIRKDRLVLKVAEMMSTTQPHNLLVMKVDAMGREGTKLPHYIRRPKSVPDTSLLFYDIVDVQIAREQNGLRYLNEVYGNLAEFNGRGSDAICSYILHAVSKLPIIPKMLVTNLDNCLTNKSNTFFAFIGWLLLVIKELQQVFVWYCEVGHTHNSVDAFFGTITEQLKTRDVLTPQDMCLIIL